MAKRNFQGAKISDASSHCVSDLSARCEKISCVSSHCIHDLRAKCGQPLDGYVPCLSSCIAKWERLIPPIERCDLATNVFSRCTLGVNCKREELLQQVAELTEAGIAVYDARGQSVNSAVSEYLCTIKERANVRSQPHKHVWGSLIRRLKIIRATREITTQEAVFARDYVSLYAPVLKQQFVLATCVETLLEMYPNMPMTLFEAFCQLREQATLHVYPYVQNLAFLQKSYIKLMKSLAKNEPCFSLGDVIVKATQARERLGDSAVAQMYTLRNAREFMSSASDGAQSMKEVFSSIQGFLDSVCVAAETLSDAARRVMETFSRYIVKIAMYAFTLWKMGNQATLSMKLLVTATIWTQEIGMLTAPVLRTVMKACEQFVQQAETPMAQFDPATMSQETHVNLFKAFFTTITSLLQSEPSLHAGKLSLSAKKLAGFVVAVRAAESMGKYIAIIGTYLCELVSTHIFKRATVVPRLFGNDKFISIVNDWEYLKTSGVLEHIASNRLAAHQAISLVERLDQLQKDVVEKNADVFKSVLLSLVQSLKRDIMFYVDRVPEVVKQRVARVRPRPVWIHVVGPPRIGKSTTVMKFMIAGLMARLCPEIPYETATNLTYMRDTATPYWEGYYGQHVVVYDDLFQVFGNDQAVLETISELTYVTNDGIVPLNMAFQQKGKAFFTSPIIISTGNLDFRNQSFVRDNCLSKGAHLNRRRDFVIEMKADQKYMRADRSGLDPATFPECGSATSFAHLPADLYTLTMKTGEGKPLKEGTFSEVMKLLVQMAGDLCESRISVNATVENMVSQFHREVISGDYLTAGLVMEAQHVCDQAQAIPPRPVSPCDEATEDGVIAHMLPEQQREQIQLRTRDCSQRLMCQTVDPGGWQTHEVLFMQDGVFCKRGCGHVRVIPDICSQQFADTSHRPGWIEWFHYKFSAWTWSWKQWWRKPRERNYRAEISKLQTMSVGAKLTLVGAAMLVSIKAAHVLFKVIKYAMSKDPNKVFTYSHPFDGMFPQPGRAHNFNQANTDVNQFIQRAVTRWKIVVDGSVVNQIGSIDVGHSIFAIPRHFVLRMHEYCKKFPEMEVVLSSRIKHDFIVHFKDLEFMDFADERDLAFVHVPLLARSRTMVQHFASGKSNPDLSSCYLFGCRSPIYGQAVETSLVSLQNVKRKVDYSYTALGEECNGVVFPRTLIASDKGFTYTGVTMKMGDCGMVLLHTDEKIPQKILGFHTAGTDSTGYSQNITSEDVQEAYDFFSPETDVVEVDAPRIETRFLEKNPGLKNTLAIVGGGALMGTPFGLVEMKSSSANKSKICKSAFATYMEEEGYESPNAPAALNAVLVDGKLVHPLGKGIVKLTKTTGMVRQKIMNECVSSTTAALTQFYSPISERRVLTLEEALNGFRRMRQLEIATSAGFPYTAKTSVGGKTRWLEITNDEETGRKILAPGPELQAILDQRETQAKLGKGEAAVFVATLKDETRPVEKVRQAKTRVFQVGPMDFSILLRKYCGVFISDMQSQPILSEIAIGINPFSCDWDALFRRLRTHGDKFIAGDIADFDASIPLQFGMAVCEIINEYYDDELENQRLRRTMFSQMFCATELAGDTLFETWQGNPSGDAMTTIINCVVNMLLMRLAFLETTKTSAMEFTKHVEATFYGDDHVLGVSDWALEAGFTMVGVSEVFRRYGITYTAPDKTGKIVDWYSGDTVQYLKKRFAYSPVVGLVVPVPEIREVEDILYWTRGEDLNVQDLEARANACLYELTPLGRETHDAMRRKIAVWAQKIKEEFGVQIDMANVFVYNQHLRIQYPAIQLMELLAQSHEGRGPRGRKQRQVKKTQGRRMVVAQEFVVAHMDSNSKGDDALVIREVDLMMCRPEWKTFEEWKKNRVPHCPGWLKRSKEMVHVDDRDGTECPSVAMRAIAVPARECLGALSVYSRHGSDENTYEYSEDVHPDSSIFEPEIWVSHNSWPNHVRSWAVLRLNGFFHALKKVIGHGRAFNMMMTLLHRRNYVTVASVLEPDSLMNVELLNDYMDFMDLLAKDDRNSYDEERIHMMQYEMGCEVHFFKFNCSLIGEPGVYAQMHSGEEGREEQRATTTIVDQDLPHQPQIPHSTHSAMPKQQLQFVSDANFMRPILVDEFVWTAAQVAGTRLSTINLPLEWFSPYVLDKLRAWAFLRTGFRIRLMLNSTRQHYGRLVVWWVPQPRSLDVSYTLPDCAFTAQWYQLDANAGNSVVFDIPYTHNLERLLISDFVGAGGQFQASIFIDVAVILRTVSSGTTPSVGVSVFVEPIDLEVSNYTVRTAAITSMVAQMDAVTRTSSEAKVKTEDDKIISRGLRTVSNALNTFSIVPTYGGLATAASVVTAGLSSLADWFGFSVPPNLRATHPMQMRQPAMCRSEDLPLMNVIAHRADAALEVDYSSVCDTPDANSLLKFASRPGLFGTPTWDGTQVAGTILSTIVLNPFLANFSYGVNVVYLPVARVTQLCRYWRGGIRIHLSVVASVFHAGRLRIVYDPIFSASAPNTSQIPNLVNEIWDVKQQTDFSFTVPYDYTVPFKVASGALDDTTTLGKVYLVVLNSLTSGVSPVTPVTIQIFFSAAEDFQWALPYPMVGALTGVALENQEDDGYYDVTDEMVAQMDNGSMFRIDRCDFPSMSFKCLEQTPHKVLGTGQLYKVQGSCMSSEVRTFRELTNLLQFFNHPAVVPLGVRTITVSPDAPVVTAGASNLIRKVYCTYLRTFFRYWRGGFRVSIVGEQDYKAMAFANATTFSPLFLVNGALTGTIASNIAATANFMTCYFQDPRMNPVDTVIPFYSNARCLLTVVGSATNLDVPVTSMSAFYWLQYPTSFTVAPADDNIMVLLGGADDYILGYQLPSPNQLPLA